MQSVERMAPTLKKVFELPLAYNVCNQSLREVFRTEHFSLAHVTMQEGAVSLLHRHEKFSEIYYIVRGRGVLYAGDKAYKVSDDSYLVIPPNTPHMLDNNGQEMLTHLVLAAPPFNPNDVLMVDRESYKLPMPKELLRTGEVVQALDGGRVTELLSKEEQKLTGISLALGELETKKTALPHKHSEAEEAYYMLSGRGHVKIDFNTWEMHGDTFAYVPKGSMHGLDNQSGAKRLKVLCISAPPYSDDDFVPA